MPESNGRCETRQICLLAKQGADVSQIVEFDIRVHFLHTAFLEAPQLGLMELSYDLLKNSRITHIIHSAWPVNFKMALGSFISHIAGLRALIDFCAQCSEHPKILFVSSLSSIKAISSKMSVPELIIADHSAPSTIGYGRSKYVAAHVLNHANQKSHGSIQTAILRVGQIAGPFKSSKAAWPEREWLPSLVISSQTVGALPDSLGRMENINWIPVDLLATA